MRCDANISVRLMGDTHLGKRVEVKNLNSIRNVKRAIEIEKERLIQLVENGNPVVQETRSYDADKNITFSLRSKEDAEDYRYFPEPDLPPFHITAKYISEIKNSLPPLPEVLKEKYTRDFGLSALDAAALCADKSEVDYFESLIRETKNYKAAANWMLGPLRYYCNENNISMAAFPLKSRAIADLISMVEAGQLSFSNASTRVMTKMIENTSVTAKEAAASLNLLQENDQQAIETWVMEAIEAMPDKVKEYQSGKKGLIGLFAGEVKKRSKGKADMQVATKLLTEKLNK